MNKSKLFLNLRERIKTFRAETKFLRDLVDKYNKTEIGNRFLKLGSIGVFVMLSGLPIAMILDADFPDAANWILFAFITTLFGLIIFLYSHLRWSNEFVYWLSENEVKK